MSAVNPDMPTQDRTEREMQEISRIITALGAVVATSGLVVYGMGASYWDPSEFDMSVGVWMMVLGVIATIVGIILYQRTWVEDE